MAKEQPQTRRAYRKSQKAAVKDQASRAERRAQVERDYQRAKKRQFKTAIEADIKVTDPRVTGLKKKLNWAIGLVVVLIVIVYGVLLLL